MQTEVEITKEVDPLYPRAVDLVRDRGEARVSFLQQTLSIGYNRACRHLEAMEADGIVGPIKVDGTREVYNG